MIYMAESPGGKRYIGQTRLPLSRRIGLHKTNKNKHCRALAAAMVKYGNEMKWCIIAEPPVACLDEFEAFYIRELGTVSPGGYNLTHGGDSHGGDSDETRVRKSAAHRGRKHTAESRANMSAGQKKRYAERGNPLTGRKRPAEVGRKVSATTKGKPRWTAEQRAEIGRRQVGRKQSPETIAKRAAKLRGKKHSAERRARASERTKRFYAENPEARIRSSEGQKRRWDNPAEHKKSSVAAKRRVARQRQRKTGMLV